MKVDFKEDGTLCIQPDTPQDHRHLMERWARLKYREEDGLLEGWLTLDADDWQVGGQGHFCTDWDFMWVMEDSSESEGCLCGIPGRVTTGNGEVEVEAEGDRKGHEV